MTGSRPYSPNPYRRAIAHAIQLERTWDRLVAFDPRPTPFDRITPQGAREFGNKKLSLPHPLTPEKLCQLHEERAQAIAELHRDLSPTFGFREGYFAGALLEESLNTREDEQYHTVPRRRHVRSVTDDPDIGTAVYSAIAREADRPEEIKPSAPNRHTPTRTTRSIDRDSIAIDLILHSLLDLHKVNREALHREITAIRRKTSHYWQQVEIVSPSTGANTGIVLKSLGAKFPPTWLRLVGMSLDIHRLDAPSNKGGIGFRYSVERGHASISMDTISANLSIYDLPGRGLQLATNDKHWHPNLIISEAAPIQMLAEGTGRGARIKLFPTRTHIDPPGSPPPVIHPTLISTQATPVDKQRSSQWRHLDLVPVIEDALRRHGLASRIHTIKHKEGQGLILQMAGPNSNQLKHSFPFVPDTLDDGRDAIDARVQAIASYLSKIHNPPKSNLKIAPSAPAKAISVGPRRKPLTLDKDDLTLLEKASKVDVLLGGLLYSDTQGGSDPELHYQEGILAIKSARIDDGIYYRLERFDRVMGKPSHAIAIIEINRSLGADLVERLRDGSISILIKKWLAFGSSQVRRVTRGDESTTLTIRVPLMDASEATQIITLPKEEEAQDNNPSNASKE